MSTTLVEERAAPTGERRAVSTPGAAVVAILLIAALTKLAIAWVTPITSDEAFHWLQGQRLAWGFGDHPPGTAALSRLGTAWLGDGWLGLRVFPIAGSLLCSLIAYAMLREVGADRRHAATAAAFVQLLPMVGIGMLMVPCVPHTPLVFAAEYFLLRALRRSGVANHVAWGVLLGAAALTYYLAAAAAIAGAVFLARDPRGRRALRDWRLWLGAAVAAAVFAPNLLWNVAHGKESAVHFQLLDRNTAGFTPQYVVAFAALAVVMAGPLLLPALLAAARSVRAPANVDADDWRPFFATFVLAVLALFAAVAIVTRAGAHWAVLAYLNVPLLLLAPRAEPVDHRWQRAALVTGAVIAAGVLAAAAIGMERAVALVPGNGDGHSVSRARFLHFADAAAIASRAAGDARREGHATLLAADRWSQASLLAFHGNDTHVAVYPPSVRHGRDFATWSHGVTGPFELIYVTTTPDVDAAVRGASASVQWLAAVGEPVAFAWVHRCSGFVPPPQWR